MKRRLELLAFIRGELEAGRTFPTHAAMARQMKWKNASSCVDALWALVKDGYLAPSQWAGRDIKFQLTALVSSPRRIAAPIKGKEP